MSEKITLPFTPNEKVQKAFDEKIAVEEAVAMIMEALEVFLR